MKRHIKKPLALARETVRVLEVVALEPVAAAAYKATVLNYGKALCSGPCSNFCTKP